MRRRWPVWGGVVDLDRREVLRQDGAVSLTPQEVALCAVLFEAGGRPVHRDALLVSVWGFPKAVHTRAVDHAVARLRVKLEADPADPRVILGVRGVGYRYDAPQDEVEGLVGRRADAQALRHAVQAHRRVTLVGPAGVGKTALATWWAQETGAPVVALEPLSGDGVQAGIARALGLPHPPERAGGEVVGRALVARGLRWLVLDAAEHVLDEVAALATAWQDLAPELGLLITCHGPLGLRDEAVVSLDRLDPGQGAELLRRRLSRPGVHELPTQGHLAELADRLDGLPLALELLAARAHVTGLQALGELTSAPAALRSEGKDASLLAAVERTWRWLDEPLQQTLSALCLFPSPPAPSVLGALLGCDPAEVQQRLDALAVRALHRAPRGPAAVVRQVAVREASRALSLAQARLLLDSPVDQEAWLVAADRVRPLHPERALDLLLGAVRDTLSAGPLRPRRADDAVDLALDLGCRVGEALVLRGAVRTLSGDLHGAMQDLDLATTYPEVRGEALARRAWVAAITGELSTADTLLAEALDHARGTRDAPLEAMVRVRWGSARHFAGDPAGALRHLQHAVGLYEALGDVVQAGRATSSVGLMWLELGDPAAARAALHSALEVDRTHGAGVAVPQHLLNLGGAALDAGDLDEARTWLAQAEEAARAVGDLPLAAQARMSQGLADLLAGAPALALRHLAHARALLEGLDSPVLVALAWAWTALAAARAGDGSEARRAWREVPSQREALPGVVQEAVAVCEAVVHDREWEERPAAPSLLRTAWRAARA